MRPVQCAPRGSSYAISHESQSCVLSLPVRLALLRVACWGDCVSVSCVVMSTEVTDASERGFRIRDGTVESRDKTIRCTTCVFVYSNIVVLHQILSCTICTCDALPPR